MRLFMIATGVIILAGTILSLARKHMTESFCIAWGVVAAGAIFGGIVLRPAGWSRFVSWHGLSLILFGVIFLLAAAFYFSVRISQLNRQVKELAIKVALLDRETAALLSERDEAAAEQETQAYEEEAAVRY